MKIYLHALYTWLTSVALMIIFLFAYFWLDGVLHSEVDVFFFGLTVTVFAVYILSLPAFIISIALLTFLLGLDLSIYLKLTIWIFCVFTSILLNVILISFLTESFIRITEALAELWLAFPAAFIAIMIRYKKFFLLAYAEKYESNTDSIEQLFNNNSSNN